MAYSKSLETAVEVEPYEENIGRLDYNTPVVSRSASLNFGMVERLGPTTLSRPVISTSETREVETGVVVTSSVLWPDLRNLSSIAGSQALQLVMVREAGFASILMPLTCWRK